MNHVFLHGLQIVSNHHGSAAQHIARPHQYWQSDFFRDLHRFLRRERSPCARLRNIQLFEKGAEASSIFGQVNRFRVSADDFCAVAFQIESQIERSLPAELHDHALRLFPVENGENILERKRLEIKAVGSVVVGRHRLRIAIHHDRFESIFLQREGGMATAIIELNSLPDAVRPAAENHDFRAVHDGRFVFLLVRRIHVRREGFEFRGASIHALKHRNDPQFMPARAH